MVNSTSPPKAQRTLVDAEVAGTPSSEDWPAIIPEVMTSTGHGSAGNRNIDKDNFVAHESFLATVPQQRDPKLTTAASDDLTATNANTPPSAFKETPHMLIDVTPALEVANNPSTNVDVEAIEIPLAQTIVFPPRVSSKQASPVSFVGPDEAQMVSSAAPAIVHHREISSSAQWPLLDTIPCEEMNGGLYSDKDDDGGGASESTDAYHTAAPERASAGSKSTELIAFVNNKEPKDKDEGFRTKRISNHPSRVVEGMTLKISSDADALLLHNNALPLPNTTRNSTSAIALRTASRFSAGISRNPMFHANGKKVSHGITPEERGSSRLPMGEHMQQYSADATLTRSSPHLHRAGGSPGYDQIRGASSKLDRMVDQRATLRKVVNNPKPSTKPISGRLEGGFNKPGNASRKADERNIPDKKIKHQRSLKNLIFHKKTSEENVPPLPTVPKRSFKNSTFMGTTLGGRFAKMSQKGVEEKERHPAKSGERVSSQATHNKSDLADTQAASTDPRIQMDNTRVGTYPGPAQNGKSEIVSDTTTEVDNTTGSAPKLSSAALDRLRGLEIAEVRTALHVHSTMPRMYVLTVLVK